MCTMFLLVMKILSRHLLKCIFQIVIVLQYIKFQPQILCCQLSFQIPSWMPYFQEVFFLEFIFKLKQNHTPFFPTFYLSSLSQIPSFMLLLGPSHSQVSLLWLHTFLYACTCILLYICMKIQFLRVFLVCVFMVLGLTTLHWATREGAHLWKRLCLLPEVISCLQSLIRGEIINSILRGISTGRTF